MDARWWRLAALLVAGRSLDIFSTWLITPDLKAEINPLVANGGAGWVPLILVQVAFVALCLALYAYALRHPELGAPGLSGWKALAHAQFGPGVPAWHLLWRFPARGRWGYSLGGWWVPAAAVGTSFVFVLNLLMLTSQPYRDAVRFLSFGHSFVYLLEAVVTLVFLGLVILMAWRSRRSPSAPQPASF